MGKQIKYSIGKANRKPGLIKHSFKHLNKRNMKSLYTSLVRKHLEYGATVWNPYIYKKMIEIVQRKATKIHSFRGMIYEKRLNEFKMITCEERRTRGV